MQIGYVQSFLQQGCRTPLDGHALDRDPVAVSLNPSLLDPQAARQRTLHLTESHSLSRQDLCQVECPAGRRLRIQQHPQRAGHDEGRKQNKCGKAADDREYEHQRSGPIVK